MEKKLLFIILFVFIGMVNLNAQLSIPNGDMEKWDSLTYSYPTYYIEHSNQQTISNNLPINCEKTTDAFHGNSALKLTSVANQKDTMFGYISNGNTQDDVALWHGGAPISEKPTGIRGYYKSDIPAGDSALILASFSLNGTQVGMYYYKLYGTHTTYTLFDYTFNPPLSVTPDSVLFAVTSGDAFTEHTIPGSMIIIDSVSLKGITNQPIKLNGDFELWNTNKDYIPKNFYTENLSKSGVIRSTDAYKGKYATELITILSDKENKARSSKIGTGYYVEVANNQWELQGGFPYSQQIDTLIFWYKYTPQSNDTASIQCNFRKNGAQIHGVGQFILASATYKLMEIPFNIGQVPDTVVIEFQSSIWTDSLPSFVGSKLIIDEVYFKSQYVSTKIENYYEYAIIQIHPNPSKGIFKVVSTIKNPTIEITNIIGERVYSEKNTSANSNIILDLSNQPKGLYLLKITGEDGKWSREKIIIE
ncbi:MAG TPA: T9SS type A sorting domain-containing protein [Bacteroidales bacterium]|mgnify:CR=1 FL=1|nr:T9SS type A sorting domain-containing protein [Bacteroidales bacterium]HQI46286.1 T9SS type A sorting domain-containing protein [Bacteroidales bacterium]